MAFIAAATTSRTFQCPENSLTHNIHLLFSYFFFHRRCRCLPPPFHVLQSGKKYSSLFIFFFNIFIGLFFSFFFLSLVCICPAHSPRLQWWAGVVAYIEFASRICQCASREKTSPFSKYKIESKWNEMKCSICISLRVARSEIIFAARSIT